MKRRGFSDFKIFKVFNFPMAGNGVARISHEGAMPHFRTKNVGNSLKMVQNSAQNAQMPHFGHDFQNPGYTTDDRYDTAFFSDNKKFHCEANLPEAQLR